jgi:beta-glucosidase
MPDRFYITRRALLGSTILTLTMPAIAAAKPLYRDPTAPTTARVNDLLARMTLEEKAVQMRSMWATKIEFLDAQGAFSENRAAKSLANGIGQIARPSDIRGFAAWDTQPFRDIDDTVALVNTIQRFLVERTRLGIPALFHDELAHGFLANDSTIFPIPPGLASTWDPELVERVFTVAAREARLRGTHIALTPVVDLMREPRYGRSEEFFGEDPYLVAQMGAAAVRGLQGRQRPLGRERVFATLKHFVHGVPQGGLNIGPADFCERTLRENFLVPFAEIIKSADPAIIMPSYNEVEGVPSHANVELLQSTGRQRLGFRGVYFSDYEGIANLMDQHHVAGTKDDAAVLALNAGVAADLPEGTSFARLPELVRAGRIHEPQLDAMVAQILALKFEVGLFENPYLDRWRARQETNTPADIALARTAAEKALVLLKNDGILPLEPKSGFRLAVIGPNSVEPLLGGYSGDNARAVGILDGVRRAAPPGMMIEQSDGVWITAPDGHGRHRSYSPLRPVPEADDLARIAHAVEVAKRSDALLLVIGDVPAITREAVDVTLPGDRSSLGLWGRQDSLVDAMIATGKPMIALLLNGRPLSVSRLAQQANALLEGWYLGQEGGNAFANVLFGKVNPGGKLTVSFPRSVGELPVYYNQHPSAYVNQYVEGKRFALFPFGHGLSYTTFDISPPRLGKSQISAHEDAAVEVDVVNTGTRAGDEVVQLYIRAEVSSVPRPVLELKGFQRVSLSPGQRRTLNFWLTPDSLAFWNIDMKWVVEPGIFTISVGSSSTELKSARLTVSGQPTSHNPTVDRVS